MSAAKRELSSARALRPAKGLSSGGRWAGSGMATPSSRTGMTRRPLASPAATSCLTKSSASKMRGGAPSRSPCQRLPISASNTAELPTERWMTSLKGWPALMSSTSMKTRSAPKERASSSLTARAYPAASSRR